MTTSKFISCVLRFVLLAFLIATISGCSLAFTRSADAWVSLGAPPSGVASVIAASGSEIWVNSNGGDIYGATVTFQCETGEICWEWQPVKTLPDYAKSISDESTGPQSSDQCDTLNSKHPAANPNGKMIECIYSPALAGETIAQFYFARMADGTILFLDNSSGFNPFLINSLQYGSDLLKPAG